MRASLGLRVGPSPAAVRRRMLRVPGVLALRHRRYRTVALEQRHARADRNRDSSGSSHPALPE